VQHVEVRPDLEARMLGETDGLGFLADANATGARSAAAVIVRRLRERTGGVRRHERQ
jgi:hypothetical protein